MGSFSVVGWRRACKLTRYAARWVSGSAVALPRAASLATVCNQ